VELGSWVRRHSVAFGAVLMGILALVSVGGLVVAQSRLEDLDLARRRATPVTTTSGVPDGADTPADASTDALAADLLAEINTARTNAAVTTLGAHPRLARNAQRWAEHMADAGDLSHQDLHDVLALGFTMAGETIVSGIPDIDAASIQRSWMESPPNRATLVDEAFVHAGVGVARDDDGQVWVAVVLAG
jgi:uncharacterized protein YkwD